MVPPAVRNESNLRIGGYNSLYDTPITELKRAIRTAGPPQALRLGSAAGAAAPRPAARPGPAAGGGPAAAARRRKVSQQSLAAVCWPLILWSLPHFPATFFWRLEKNVHANSSAISRCPRGGRRCAGAGRAALELGDRRQK